MRPTPVQDRRPGTSADVLGRQSWTGVGLILMGKNIEKKKEKEKLKEKKIFLLKSHMIW